MKFINLLKKELSELINKQMIISLVVMLAIFFIMGNVMESATSEIVEEAKSQSKVKHLQYGRYRLHKEMIDSFKENGGEVNLVSVSGDDYASAFKEQKDLKSFVLIPEGFAEAVQKGEKPEVLSISRIKGSAAFSNMTGGPENTLSAITLYVSQKLADQKGVTTDQLKTIEDPLTVTEHTVVADKSAKVSVGCCCIKGNDAEYDTSAHCYGTHNADITVPYRFHIK